MLIDAEGVLGPAKFTWDYNQSGLDMVGLLAGKAITLSGTFVWEGTGTISDEHVILALTQRAPGADEDELFDTGIGAALGDAGLAIELWTGNGTAIAWDAVNHDRQAYAIPSGDVLGMQLAEYPVVGGSFITSYPPGWALRRGERYTLRLFANGEIWPGWTALRLELFHMEHMLQRARMNFITQQYFQNKPIQATVGKAGEGSSVWYGLKTELLSGVG